MNVAKASSVCLWVALLLASSAIYPAGNTLHVESNGLDALTCGSKEEPCRSISAAIRTASAGDTVMVGPGRYGDLNGDSILDDPGEEVLGPVGECIVCIDKPLRVLSSHGAEVTVIQAPEASPEVITHLVRLSGADCTFGQRGRGFTLRGAANGLHAEGERMRIAGNIAVDNFDFGMSGSGSGEFIENIAISNSIGISSHGTWTLTQNTAMANILTGIGASGDVVRMRENVSSHNGRGFVANAARAVLEGNIAIGNDHPEFGDGFYMESPNLRFVGNTALANRSFGVDYWPYATSSATIRENNVYGNDANTNCGLVNRSGVQVDARHNYWGAATGPGPDPADNAGPSSGCDVAGTTMVTPFAARPFPIRKNPAE
jgi:hypothetical protein